MALATHSGDTDLLLPMPAAGEQWDPHLIHTHYFGFCVPEAAIGASPHFRVRPSGKRRHVESVKTAACRPSIEADALL